MAIPILKVLLVLVILAVMVIVLVTINHVFAGGFDCSNEDIDELRQDLIDNDDVIPDKSSFRDLVEKPVKAENSDFKRYR